MGIGDTSRSIDTDIETDTDIKGKDIHMDVGLDRDIDIAHAGLLAPMREALTSPRKKHLGV